MWKKIGNGLGLTLFLIGIVALMGVVCVESNGFPAGELTEHYEWIAKVIIYCDLALGVAFFLCIGKIRVFYRWEDLLILVMMIWLLLRYDMTLGLSPERFYFLTQCGVLWFILRIGLATYPLLSRLIPWVVLFMGFFEAILGFLQLYGYRSSHHGLFLLTGTFFNPGPYSGYLAIAFVVGVGLYRTVMKRWLRYILCVVLGIIVCLLPAGMSRSAWFAAGLGCVGVFLMQPGTREWLTRFFSRYVGLRRIVPVVGILVLIVFITGLFYLKPDSANGRLFMWKITARVIAEHPFTGCGLGGFPSAYGDAQEAYFAKGLGNAQEEYVAGSPEYAFNEYLQLASEGGIFLLLAALAFVGISICRGIQRNRTATVAGIVTFGVFAFFSYPLQLPSMVVLLVLLLAVSQAPSEAENQTVLPKIAHRLIAGLAILGYLLFLLFIYYLRQDYMDACRRWQTARVFYNSQAYQIASKEYNSLFYLLKDRPIYLFESAMCARNVESYEHSNFLLNRASLLSGDPMIENVRGRNYVDIGRRDSSCLVENYQKSELYLWKSVNRLPGRLYPYFLLAKLYNDPYYFHPRLARKMARIVLTKKEKIPSPAIRQMREEMEKLLSVQ